MVVAAKVKIVNNSKANVDGSSNDSKVLKDLLKEFKGLKDIFSKASKLGRAGLGGGLGGATGAASILSKIPGMKEILAIGLGVTGLGKGLMKVPGAPGTDTAEITNEKVINDQGEEQIWQINQKTGEIVQKLTMREALEQHIVDKTGSIVDYLDNQNSIWDQMTRDLPTYRDAVRVNADTVGLIAAENEIQLKILKDINKSNQIIAERLAKEARRANASERAVNQAIKVSTSGGYMTVGYGQLSAYEQAAYSNQLKSEEPRAQNLVSQQQSAAPPTAPFVDILTSRET